MGFARNPTSCVAAAWAESQGRRETMEDGRIFIDGFLGVPAAFLAGVYDGHGGRAAVDVALRELHVAVARRLQPALARSVPPRVDSTYCEKPHAVPDALAQALHDVDEALRAEGVTQSGCTVCVCLVLPVQPAEGSDGAQPPRKLWTTHLGDARAVLCKGGVAMRLTSPSDHKATDEAEVRRVQDAGGYILNDRVNGVLAISRALGDLQLKKPAVGETDVVSAVPDCTSIDLSPEDVYLTLACDGVWDVADDQEAVNIVSMSCNLVADKLTDTSRETMAEIAVHALVEECVENRCSADNVSCMAIFFQ